MKLTPMRYKNFVWPHNPRIYSIDYARKMAVNKIPFGGYHLQDLGQTNRIMAGEGEFTGEDAYQQFGKLANAFYDPGPGTLIHPLWQSARVHFVSLRLEQEPRADYVRYSFVFWEDGFTTPVVKRVELSTTEQENGEKTAGKAYHTVVKGDTLWAIARMYGLTLIQLLKRNPEIKNPNRIYVGEKVRLK
jgi:prophage DNA circulation protein